MKTTRPRFSHQGIFPGHLLVQFQMGHYPGVLAVGVFLGFEFLRSGGDDYNAVLEFGRFGSVVDPDEPGLELAHESTGIKDSVSQIGLESWGAPPLFLLIR